MSCKLRKYAMSKVTSLRVSEQDRTKTVSQKQSDRVQGLVKTSSASMQSAFEAALACGSADSSEFYFDFLFVESIMH